MKKRNKFPFAALMLAVLMLLGGCVKTVDQLYQLPRRSEGYHNLQAVMDRQMVGMQYCAPSSGENQQAVQIADLDQDGVEEVLLFAKDSDTLRIIIFRMEGNDYTVGAQIDLTGIAFDQVEYVQMDETPGLEIVVGTELCDAVIRRVNVYSYEKDRIVHHLSTNYQKFFHCDLDENGRDDLVIIHSGEDETDPAFLQMYSMSRGALIRTGTERLSQPAHNMKRIVSGNLSGGKKALFVDSAADRNSIETDVFAWIDGGLQNITGPAGKFRGESTRREYYIYGEDIDSDGEMELPQLLTMQPEQARLHAGPREHLIRWYALTPEGDQVSKRYTYHNYQRGWYVELESNSASRIFTVPEDTGVYAFYVTDASGVGTTKLWRLYTLTGENRMALAEQENRFILAQTDSTVFAAELEQEAIQKGATEEMICKSFHLIQRGWKTGEM